MTGFDMRYEEVTLRRDCEVVQIPFGDRTVIPAETRVVITQALGESFTIQVPEMGGLFRVAGKDADALGKARPVAPDQAAEASRNGGPVDEQLIWDQLRNVYDPEIPVNVVELGLIYDLHVEPHPEAGSIVDVKMTLTAPGCGMGGIIASDAQSRIESVPGVREARVEVVFDPPWNQSMMSEAAKLELGFL